VFSARAPSQSAKTPRVTIIVLKPVVCTRIGAGLTLRRRRRADSRLFFARKIMLNHSRCWFVDWAQGLPCGVGAEPIRDCSSREKIMLNHSRCWFADWVQGLPCGVGAEPIRENTSRDNHSLNTRVVCTRIGTGLTLRK